MSERYSNTYEMKDYQLTSRSVSLMCRRHVTWGIYCPPQAFGPTLAKSRHCSPSPSPERPKRYTSFTVCEVTTGVTLEGFARIAKPLSELMKKDAPFVWSPACQEAFDGLRSTLANAVMRHHFDPSLPTTLTTDAADGRLGAAMHQALLANPSQPRPMAFISKTMIPAELNYFIHDKELLAIVQIGRAHV